MTEAADLDGAERAAIFLMSLGEAEAAEVMKHMGVGEVQKVGRAMAELRNVTRGQAEHILGRFTDYVEGEAPLAGRSPRFLRTLLTKSLGEERASSMLERLGDGSTKGLDSLQMMDPKEVADVIVHEHPQVIAIVLSGLEDGKAGKVIEELPTVMATDLVRRIAQLEEVPEAAIEDLDSVMQQRFDASGNAKVMPMGGVRAAAEILNAVDKPVESSIFEILDEQDAELSQEIKENMFVFANLADVDDRGIQLLIREITSDVLILALKGAESALKEKIFSNMSKRAAELLQDDLDAKGPVRLSEVEEAQREVVSIARRMEDEGTLMLNAGSDEFV